MGDEDRSFVPTPSSFLFLLMLLRAPTRTVDFCIPPFANDGEDHVIPHKKWFVTIQIAWQYMRPRVLLPLLPTTLSPLSPSLYSHSSSPTPTHGLFKAGYRCMTTVTDPPQEYSYIPLRWPSPPKRVWSHREQYWEQWVALVMIDMVGSNVERVDCVAYYVKWQKKL